MPSSTAMENQKPIVWKWIASLLGSVMVTGIISWFSFGGGLSRTEAVDFIESVNSKHGLVSRSETSKMIKTESPWIADKSGVQAKLESIEQKLDRIENKLDR